MLHKNVTLELFVYLPSIGLFIYTFPDSSQRLRGMSTDPRRIALQRIETLFKLAREVIHDKPDLAQRYIEIARKIAMRTRLHLPRQYRSYICKHCKKFILPGVNSRVRVQHHRESHIVITCLYCGASMRKPLKRKIR